MLWIQIKLLDPDCTVKLFYYLMIKTLIRLDMCNLEDAVQQQMAMKKYTELVSEICSRLFHRILATEKTNRRDEQNLWRAGSKGSRIDPNASYKSGSFSDDFYVLVGTFKCIG